MRATCRLIYDRRHTATQSKPAPIHIEVYFKGQRKWISTGIKILPVHWYNKKGIYIAGRPDATALNDELSRQLQHTWKLLLRQGNDFTFSSLTDQTNDFIQYALAKIDARTDIRPSTATQHRIAIQNLVLYGKIRTFADLTENSIRRYDQWLHTRGIIQSTIHGYHKRIKPYIRMALHDGLLDHNPYEYLTIPRGQRHIRRYLTDAELLSVQTTDIPEKRLSQVRDLFIFQCYTGLSYSDLAHTDYRHDLTDRNGHSYLISRRVKSSEPYYLRILPPALEILQRYEYQLPIISNEKYNTYLKEVASLSGLSKPLTSHMARHTFAVWTLNQGIPMEVVSKMLGHTKITTTQIYAELVQPTLDTAFDFLANHIPK